MPVAEILKLGILIDAPPKRSVPVAALTYDPPPVIAVEVVIVSLLVTVPSVSVIVATLVLPLLTRLLDAVLIVSVPGMENIFGAVKLPDTV